MYCVYLCVQIVFMKGFFAQFERKEQDLVFPLYTYRVGIEYFKFLSRKTVISLRNDGLVKGIFFCDNFPEDKFYVASWYRKGSKEEFDTMAKEIYIEITNLI